MKEKTNSFTINFNQDDFWVDSDLTDDQVMFLFDCVETNPDWFASLMVAYMSQHKKVQFNRVNSILQERAAQSQLMTMFGSEMYEEEPENEEESDEEPLVGVVANP